jgi:hypothetical protein
MNAIQRNKKFRTARDASLDEKIRNAGEALKEQLKTFRGLSVSNHKSEQTDTNGRYTIIAKWRGLPNVELWLDKAAGPDADRFWVGFSSESSKIFDALLELLPKELVPGPPLTKIDWKWDGKHSMLKKPNQKELTIPFLEKYPGDGGILLWNVRLGRQRIPEPIRAMCFAS